MGSILVCNTLQQCVESLCKLWAHAISKIHACLGGGHDLKDTWAWWPSFTEFIHLWPAAGKSSRLLCSLLHINSVHLAQLASFLCLKWPWPCYKDFVFAEFAAWSERLVFQLLYWHLFRELTLYHTATTTQLPYHTWLCTHLMSLHFIYPHTHTW